MEIIPDWIIRTGMFIGLLVLAIGLMSVIGKFLPDKRTPGDKR